MEERKFFKHILKNRFFQMALFFNIAEGIIRIALSIKGGNIVDCVRLNAGDEIIRILLTSIQCLSPAKNCQKWQDNCGECPLLHKDNVNPTLWFDRTSKCLNDKRKWFSAIPRLAVVGVSNWVASEASKSFLGNRNPIGIYNWIDSEVFQPRETSDLRKELNLEDKFVVLMVTTGISEKKGYLVLKALSEMLSSDYQLIVVGKNPLNLEIPKNVIHIHHTNDAVELSKYYSMADVCVNTTKFETFGKVTAEALCCGPPVIVYNNTASPELVGPGCGYVVDENAGFEAVAEAVNKIRKTGKEAMTSDCLKFAREQFSKENGVHRYMDLYEALLKK